MRVRNADGQVLEIDEADARFYEQRGFTPETPDQLYSGIRTEAATPEDRGIIGTINAGATGFLSGATLGASDYLLKGALNEDQFKRLAYERESHPVASVTGQIAGGILPAFAAPGSVLGSSPSGLVSHAVNRAVAEGRAIGGAAGTGRVLAASGVEGAIQNAGAYFADTALADRDLSAEGIAGALGIGFGFGAGASAAVLGVTQGTIAARRMFSRIADGSERAATDAEQAWQRTYQETVEANNAAIEVARAKLAQAQAARAQAQLASQREAANVAAAKVRPGIDWASDAASPSGGAVVSMAPGTIDNITGAAGKIEMAGQLRDRAMLRPPMTESAAADLATAVAEHDAALAELDDLLQRLNAPAVEPGVVPRRIVPIAEFGAPGQRGYTPGEVAAPRPPTVVEAATGDVTAVGKRRAVAEGTPIGIGAPETIEQQWEAVMARLKGETDVPTRLRLQAEADELMDRMAPMGPSTGAAQSIEPPQLRTVETEDGNVLLEGLQTADSRFEVLSWEEYDALKNQLKTVLTQEERDAVVEYSGESSYRMNKRLRDGLVSDSDREVFTGVDAALEKGRLARPVRVYRGLEGKDAVRLWEGMRPGDRFVDPAWGSSSTDFGMARRGQLTLAVDVPEGYPAAAIPTQNSLENELLIRRDTTYEVLSIGKLEDGHVVAHVRVIPTDGPQPITYLSKSQRKSAKARTSPIDIHRAVDMTPVQSTPMSKPSEPTIKGKTIAELKHPDETVENFVLRRMRTQGEAFGDPSMPHNDKRFLGSLGIDWAVPENRAVMMRMMREGKAVFARADLVGAMDPAMVKASEIVELGPTGREISSWHFILDTGQPVKFPETTPKIKPIAADAPSALEDLVRAQRATSQDTPVRTISSRQEFHKYQDELRAMLTPDEIKNSLRYSREEYNNINRFLRGDKRSPKLSSDEAEIIPALDSVIAKSPSLKETMITHRAIHFDPGEGAHALRPGDVFSDPAYLSTSWRADNINRFGNVHFVVTSPPGTKIAAIPSAAPEGEFLFGRNARLRITAREELPGDRIRLHATAEPAQAASISPTDSLTGQLRATLGGLDSGKGLNELGAPARAEYAATKALKTKESSEYFRAKALERRSGHPLSIRELETAHDAALERAATAAEPAAREAAEAEVQAIERHLTAVGARPGAVEDVAAIAPAVTKYERASAKVVEALGDEAPPLAREAAKAVRAAEETAERRFMDRTTRAIDDNAEESWMTEARQMMAQEGRSPRFTPAERSKRDAQLRKWEMAAARTDKSKADARLASARVAETEAKIGMRQAQDTAYDARYAMEQARPASTEAIGGRTSRLGAAALTVGVAGELGVPGIPRPTDIPVVGPLLGMYLKYRAIKAAAGRFVGRVSATGDTRAAALVARTKDRMALAVDRTLGLVAETAPKARGPAVASVVALGRRVFDDGEPDAKKGASPSELAAVRIREISTAASRPDLVKAMVRREMRGVSDPDLIAAAEAHLIARFDHLANVIPNAPPPNPYSRREWRPSPAAASELGHRLAVADDPEAMFAPNATPASIETARALWPKLLDLAKRRLIERIGDAKQPVTYQQRLRGSLLFQIPLDDSMRPENAAILQGASTGVPPAPSPTAPTPPVPAIAGPIDLTAMYQPGTDRRALMR